MPAATPYAASQRLACAASGRHASLAILAADLSTMLVALLLAGGSANLIRSALHIDPLDIASQKYASHALITLTLGAAMIVWLSTRKHYSTRQTFSNQTKDIFLGCLAALFAAAFVDFAAKADMARLSVFLTWGLACVLIISGRFATMHALMARDAWYTPTLLLGARERKAHFARITQAHPELGFKIAAALDIGAVLQMFERQSDDRKLSILASAMSRWEAKSLLIAPGAQDYRSALDLIEILQRLRIPFVFAPESGSLAVAHMMMQQLAPFDGIMLTPLDSLDRPIARLVKQMVEQTAAGLALIVLSPLFLFLCLCIGADGGPAFFRQKRIGRNGKPFFCLKFRSMAPDAERRLERLLREDPAAAAEWARNQKLSVDPRITAIGRFLRRTSLDELPQLINVVRGEMSIVGPRPVVPDEIDRYGACSEYYYRVRPGITGLWQVNGRNDTTYDERVRLDSYYVRNWSLWRDLCIACKTIPEMLWKKSGL